MTDKDRILRKIRACFARADETRNSNEHERATALRQANALMDKYGIELVELGDTDELGERGKEGVLVDGAMWRAIVYNEIAKLYGCKVYRSTSGGGQVFIIGRQHYRSVVIDMALYVCNSIRQESLRLRGVTASYRRSFQTGAADGVANSVYQIMEHRAEGKSAEGMTTGKAMVLVNHYESEMTANEDWLFKHVGRLRKGRADGSRNHSGYSAGHEHGRSISLNDQLAGSSSGPAPKRLQ